MAVAPPLQQLLEHRGDIWLAGENQRRAEDQVVASGYPTLDPLLPGRGWPVVGMTELVGAQRHVEGAFRLLLPALRELLAREPRHLLLINPPYLPYAPELALAGLELQRLWLLGPIAASEAEWAAEQVLASGLCAAVVCWGALPELAGSRRLQLAAERGGAWGVWCAAGERRDPAAPCMLRLGLRTESDGLRVQLLKVRGGRAGQVARIAWS